MGPRGESIRLARRVNGRMRRPKHIRHDRLPSKETLASLLDSCTSRTRAAVLLLASSGMRVGELVRLRIKDLDLSSSPAELRIREAGEPERYRTCYITDEARAAVQRYLDERREKNQPIDEESALFAYESGSPMTPQAMLSLIQRGFESTGLRGPKMRLDSQILRRWFKKQLIGAGAPRVIVDALCGNVRPPKVSHDQVRHWYIRAIPNLTILKAAPP